MLKRVVTLLLTAVLILCMAACGGDKAVNSEVPELTWLVPGDTQNDTASVMAEVNKIIEPAIGAKLKLTFIDAGSFSEKMNMFMASQNDFDIAFTGYVNKYRGAVENEGLEPLTELIKTEAPKLFEAIPEYCWKDSRINGEIYAVPNVQVEFYQYCLYVQKELAEKYNLDPESIKVPNDIEPFLKQIKENEPDMYPIKPNGTLMWWKPFYEEVYTRTMMVIDSKGGSDKLLYLRDTPEFKLAVATLRDWYLKGYIRKDISSATSDSSEVNNNKYAVIAGQWKPGQELDISRSRKKDYIAIKIGDPYMINGNVNQAMTAIGVNSKHKKEAIKLLEMVNTNNDLYNLIGYGIKDKHYKINADGFLEFIDGSGYKPNAGWKFGNQFNAYIVNGQSSDVWKITEQMNNDARKSPILGFTPDTSEISNKLAQMTAILDEYESMNQGSQDYNEFKDTMAQRLASAGEKEVFDTLQKQIKEFKK